MKHIKSLTGTAPSKAALHDLLCLLGRLMVQAAGCNSGVICDFPLPVIVGDKCY